MTRLEINMALSRLQRVSKDIRTVARRPNMPATFDVFLVARADQIDRDIERLTAYIQNHSTPHKPV